MTSANTSTSLQDIEISIPRLQEILTVANDWALCHGVSVKAGKEGPDAQKVVSAPYALFPSVVPAGVIYQAKSSMVHFSKLMHAVAMDHEYLETSLKSVIAVDPFMANLWNIYLKVRDQGLKQPCMLGLFRNDFMMNALVDYKPGQLLTAEQLELKQIEFNSIASSFGGITEQIGKLHRLTMGMAGKSFAPPQLPQNEPASELATGMVKAWEIYGKDKAVIVFIVSEQETNVMDQRWLEFGVYAKNPSIRVLRKTLLDVYKYGKLDKNDNLFLGTDEVALIYFRDGYTVENYPTQKEWDARLKMELSTAIKSPSIHHQLVGAKKIQQELCRPGALEKFISDKAVIKQIRATFADQYSLDMNDEGDKAVNIALSSPEKFVLKPQREGGGHNLYGENITKFFSENKLSKERSAFILMQRIFPWQQKNYLVKRGIPFELSTVISEIGVYGVFIGTADKEIENYECGHMMRTKVEGTDEGGVAAGFAVLDTPFIL